MNQGGVKHGSANQTRVDNKRERRRGAAGRAAALRRAPSDSDCSGETASLSADSGDRVVRPQPPPPRSGKSRSRRRGSEWEVLEGLKDGQRFEKRPDVFNGYLHKKRKWPLKGWHKRFFVIDGGILVYARSPTDVARGRLHGSVDVGLSVISAKARRRRIDIDADEFIYHLRAKTPEVFRTWLNVLKAHRLYRQHLLTFGARESVPKVHAPLDDMPPTDTSSRTSSSNTNNSQINSLEDNYYTDISYQDNSQNAYKIPYSGNKEIHSNRYFPVRKDILVCNYLADHKPFYSMNYAKMLIKGLKIKKSPEASQGSTDHEKQLHATDLNPHKSVVNPYVESSAMCKVSLNSNKVVNKSVKTIKIFNNKGFESCSHSNADKDNVNLKSKHIKNKLQEAASFSLFDSNKNRFDGLDSAMKRSNKSTNLVKYRNILKEPTLKRPLSNCMLLSKYKLKVSKQIDTKKYRNKAIVCGRVANKNIEVQVEMKNKEHKATQDVITISECERITEELMISLFENRNGTGKGDEVKYYINQIIKDLYEFKLFKDVHPIKTLFRTLLEYWIKHTNVSQFKEAMTRSKSINRQSNRFFTKDDYLSSVVLDKVCKETQFQGLSELMQDSKYNNNNIKRTYKKTSETKHLNICQSPRWDTESFEKERRIQELERLLKNTVYVCETKNSENREKDIKMTKTLIDNLDKLSKMTIVNESNNNNQNDTSGSSTELPKIQDTINRLISDTSLSPDMAKVFFNAYLGVLHHNSSKSATNTSTHSSDNIDDINQVACNVQAETVTKRISKSVITYETNVNNTNHKVNTKPERLVNDGQQYLKDMLDKITTIFSKIKNSNDKWLNVTTDPTKTIESKICVKDEIGRRIKEYPDKNIINHNHDNNSVVINLSKYDLEHISMMNDPAIKGIMSVTIKLKEKPINVNTSKRKHLSLKFSGDLKAPEFEKNNDLLSYINPSDSSNIFNQIPVDLNKTPYVDYSTNDVIDLKPYLSSSEATSKAYRGMHESDHSLDLSFRSSRSFHRGILGSMTPVENEGTQSCVIMATLRKDGFKTKIQTKKKVRLKECNGLTLNSRTNSPKLSFTRQTYEEVGIFDNKPKVINEEFILLLLENLNYWSKTVPGLNKDINNIYSKFKKKYGGSIRNNNNVEGISLLDKIYIKQSSKSTVENQTQTEINIDSLKERITTESGRLIINTYDDLKNISLNILSNEKSKSNIEGQADRTSRLNKFNCDDSKHTSTNTPKITIKSKISPKVTTSSDIKLTERAALNSDRFKRNKGYTINTALRYTPKGNNLEKNRIARTVRPEQMQRDVLRKYKKYSSIIKHDLIKKISFKAPKKIQTFWKSNSLGNDTDEDFKVYRIFLDNQYPVTKPSSLTVLNIKKGLSDDDDDLKTIYRCSSEPSYCSGLISPTSPPIRGPQFVSGTPGGRLASWIIESGGPLENASRELGQAQLSIQQMQRLLDALEFQQQVHHDTDVSIEGASPNVKKDRRKFGLRKKKSNSKCSSVELAPPHVDPSSSHMALSALTAPPSPGGGASSAPNSAASLPIACAAARPQSLPGTEVFGPPAGPTSLTSLTPDHQLREDFTVLAKDLLGSLKTIVATLVCERGRLRAAMEASDPVGTPGGSMMAALRTNLTSALQQNSELRSRLSRIHLASDIAEISSVGANSDQQGNRQFQQSLSYSSSCVSASEFFDAEEHDDDVLKPEEVLPGDETGVIELDGDSTSEAGSLSSEEGSASSDNSDGAMLSAEQDTLRVNANGIEPRNGSGWSRRTRLPATRPTPGGPSLWNLLYKNIGKDLSQISMPVTINEPLNMLQRLCEELEYCSLLDSAAECNSALERMALIAAFAVSAYAATAHRAASKPFNPLLAETYECRRDDRTFHFLAEQVSHHPPISACHAESPRWCFWQEARIKTKFWGKSMEFQPTGRVHVRLTTTGDHYSWNKVTTCVHNLFGGQRWVDQYGDMHITCHGTDIGCKLNFIKASSWSSSRHEVRGVVTAGTTRVRLSGRWSEALYAGDPPAARCLWRPGAMPPDHELYYGFTRFAMELNEMEPGMRDVLPHTDTRLRPDQRALEEGDVDTAEQLKHELEQAQRDRRRDSPNHKPAWFRKAIESGEETWVFTGEYWKSREAGFPDLQAPRIW